VGSWYKQLFIILNGLLYLVSIAIWIAIPDELILNLGITSLALIVTLVMLVIYRKEFYQFYMSTFFRGMSKSFVTVLLLFGILGFVNYIAFKNPKQWDITANKKNSLTDQSTRILKTLGPGLKFTIFSSRKEYGSIKALLDLYSLDNGSIEIEFVDIQVKPELVSKFGIEKSGTVLVQLADKKQQVTTLSELALTNAIVKVSRAKDPVIFYSTGHGELNLKSNENEGGTYLSRLLVQGSYDLRIVKLSAYSELPSFVAALVIWGPKQGFHPVELAVIKNYLERGGRLMVALDPNVENDKVKDLRSLLMDWGVEIENNLVVDRIKHINGSNGSVPMLDRFNSEHPITKDFKGQVFFPLVSSIRKIGGHKGKLSILGQTSPFPASWAEMSLKEFVSGVITYNPGEDIKGPLGLIGAWEREGTAARMILSGNSTFVINTYQKFSKNFTLFINSLSWLVNEERLISFNLPVVNDEPVFISAPQLGIIFYFSVLFAPLSLFIIAIVIYRRRIRL
jgi:ABC-type uncharacterized transport system involved in gliding motility auxiliary subunit